MFKTLQSTCDKAQQYIAIGGDPNPQKFEEAVYDDGSDLDTCFAKQSNDNKVYSEISHSGII
jgi:hypothetical protein